MSAKQEIITVTDRRNSWKNYQSLFSIIQQRNVNIQLPNVWLWDMIDEFLYQFQSFAQYKSRLSVLSPDDLEFLKANPDVWDSGEVKALLTQFVEKSGIRAELLADNGKQIFETEGARRLQAFCSCLVSLSGLTFRFAVTELGEQAVS